MSLTLLSGCSTVSTTAPSCVLPALVVTAAEGPAVRPASYDAHDTEPAVATEMACLPDMQAVPFAGASELTVDLLIQQVLTRNPSLAQMVAAWQAASQRYPQAIALDDPTFETTLGPASFTSTKVNPAYRFFLSQKLPFPGKRKLRGDAASAEANAAGSDVDDMRLQLVESAKDAFYEYFAVDRALDVNDRGLDRSAAARIRAAYRCRSPAFQSATSALPRRDRATSGNTDDPSRRRRRAGPTPRA